MALEFMKASDLPEPCKAENRKGRKHALECAMCSATIKHIGGLYLYADDYTKQLNDREMEIPIHNYNGTKESLFQVMSRSWEHFEKLQRGVFNINIDDRDQAYAVSMDVPKYVDKIVGMRERPAAKSKPNDTMMSLANETIECIDSLLKSVFEGMPSRLKQLYDICKRWQALLADHREEPRDDQRNLSVRLIGPKGPTR